MIGVSAETSPQPRANRAWPILFLAGAALLIATRWHLPTQSAGLKPAATRQPMRALTLPQLGGGEWNLADHRGQVVLLNYWATWCEPCQVELPTLIQISRDSAPKGLAMVGISLDTGPNTQAIVQQFVQQHRIPYPVAFPDTTLQMQYDLQSVPTTVLIDKHGRIAKTYEGPTKNGVLAKDIATLLAES
jgi:cytochrome c biogenesis protein CcmG/thiol:disulfide interchange protein DsbE